MADVSNELLYEILRPMQRERFEVKNSVGEVKLELSAVRGHFISMQQDVHNIYGVLTRHDASLERIERRLELNETIPS